MVMAHSKYEKAAMLPGSEEHKAGDGKAAS